MAMILDLGQSLTSFEWIQITAEYSNAVLVAVLPYVSDVAQRLDLPVPRPVTPEHVINCSIKPQRKLGVQVGIRGGWYFVFERGYIDTIQSPHSYEMLQDPDLIANYFGEVNMSKAEAVRLARDAIKKLGITLESVFAEQEPQVTEPVKIGTNTVPHYRIAWPDPRGGISVHVDINGDAKRLERLTMFNKSLERPAPTLNVIPPRHPQSPVWPQVNPEYARQLIPVVLRTVDGYGQKLSLPIPRPLTTNHITRFSLEENYGGPYCELELTNGWRFLYEHAMVTAYYAPDLLFGSENHRAILIREFLGEWNMTEAQAIELVRKTVAKLDYPTNLIHVDSAPQVSRPAVPGIPRFMFSWSYSLEGDSLVRSAVNAEVDAHKREVKSLYYGNIAFWNRKPPIDVRILLPAPAGANAPSAKPASNPRSTNPPPRPLKTYKSPH